jgi:hypothetical protein
MLPRYPIQMQLFTPHLTVVPSTKGWRHQCGGRSWLFHLQLEGECTVGPSYWHYYSAAMPLFNSSSLASAIPSLHSCRKHPSISGFTVSSNISENLIQRIVNAVQILILTFPRSFQRTIALIAYRLLLGIRLGALATWTSAKSF